MGMEQSTFSQGILAIMSRSTCTDVDELTPLPPYEGSVFPIHPSELIEYSPPIGHEHGFDAFGLRFEVRALSSLDVKGWDIHKVAKLVDAIAWINVDNKEMLSLDKLDDEEADGSSDDREMDASGLANIAYIALNTKDVEMKDRLLAILDEHEVLIDEEPVV